MPVAPVLAINKTNNRLDFPPHHGATTMNTKRLTRSRQDRMIAGVCGGIGRYLSIDPTLIRLAMLLLAIWGGGGILVYIIAWIVIPEEPLAETAPSAPLAPFEPAGPAMPVESTMPAEPMVEPAAPADR